MHYVNPVPQTVLWLPYKYNGIYIYEDTQYTYWMLTIINKWKIRIKLRYLHFLQSLQIVPGFSDHVTKPEKSWETLTAGNIYIKL